MATHSSIPAWEIPWNEEPGWLQSMGLQRVGYDCMTNTHISMYTMCHICLNTECSSNLQWYLPLHISVNFIDFSQYFKNDILR